MADPEEQEEIKTPPQKPKKGHKLAFAFFVGTAIILDSLEIIVEIVSAILIIFFGVGLAVQSVVSAIQAVVNPIFSILLWFWGWKNNAQGLSTVIWTGIVELIPWVEMAPMNTYAAFKVYGQIKLTEKLHLQAANQALQIARNLQAAKLKRMRRRRRALRARGVDGVRASGQIPKTRTRSMLQSIGKAQRRAERANAARSLPAIGAAQKAADFVPGSLRNGGVEEGRELTQRGRRLQELEEAKRTKNQATGERLGMNPDKASAKAADISREDELAQATLERLRGQNGANSLNTNNDESPES